METTFLFDVAQKYIKGSTPSGAGSQTIDIDFLLPSQGLPVELKTLPQPKHHNWNFSLVIAVSNFVDHLYFKLNFGHQMVPQV